jgi:hypothetical protein
MFSDSSYHKNTDPAKMLSKSASLSRENSMSKISGFGNTGAQSPSGMRSTKMQKKQPTLVEKQLETARREDFEALLQGKNLQGSSRMKKLANIIKLREALPRPAPETVKVPGPTRRVQTAASQMSAQVRPLTQNSVFSDMTAISGSTIYQYDDKLVKKLPFDVRRQLIRSMKRKWDEINKEYQLLTLSLFNLDTVNKVTKKEYCEETMARLEKEIERLSKGHVYIDAEVEVELPSTSRTGR